MTNNVISNNVYKWVSIDLPLEVSNMIAHCTHNLGLIDPNEFIVDSIENYIKCNCDDPEHIDIPEITLTHKIALKIYIPELLLFKMMLVSFVAKVSLSSITYEALRHSIPQLVVMKQELEKSNADYE